MGNALKSMLLLVYAQLLTGAVVAVIVWQLDLQLHKQSVPITTDVVSRLLTSARCTTLCDKVCQ